MWNFVFNSRGYACQIGAILGLAFWPLNAQESDFDDVPWFEYNAVHGLSYEDRLDLLNRAEWHTQQMVEYLEMADSSLCHLRNPDKRKAAKQGIMGSIPGLIAKSRKASGIGALICVLESIFGDSWDSYYECKERLSRAEYHAQCAEECYNLLAEDFDRHMLAIEIGLERDQD